MKAVHSILFAIVFILVFLVFKTPVFAQGNIPKASTSNYETRDLNVWSQNVVYEVMSAFSCQLAGVNFSHKDQKCLGFDPKTGQLGFVDNGGGALGLLTGGIAMLYTPPANTVNYISYLSQNFGISKPSFAQESQGVGFDSINPIIGIWAVFRDISYLLFIFVFIIIGVAIMLRAKIDPRTVMTIQNQIPKLIIGIIMVTLSFAIAGLLIDLMWASTYVVINVMGNADENISAKKATEGLYNHPISYFDLMGTNGNQNEDTFGESGGFFNFSQKGAGSVQKIINSSFGQAPQPNQQQECKDIFCNAINYVKNNTFIGSLFNITNMVLNPLEALMSGVVGFLVSWLIGGIAFFIILILLLWNLFKLWLTLLKCYIGILVDIIFAPFWIIGGLIPGASSLGFTGWLKDLLGNLAVFPATVGVFLLAKVFIDLSDKPIGDFFVPPLLGHLSGGSNTLGPLIALGFILAAPHVAEGVKKSFKEKFSIDLSGAGESIKTAQGMGIAFLGTARKRVYYEHMDQQGNRHRTGLLAGKVEGAQRYVSTVRMNIANRVQPVSPIIGNALRPKPSLVQLQQQAQLQQQLQQQTKILNKITKRLKRNKGNPPPPGTGGTPPTTPGAGNPAGNPPTGNP